MTRLYDRPHVTEVQERHALAKCPACDHTPRFERRTFPNTGRVHVFVGCSNRDTCEFKAHFYSSDPARSAREWNRAVASYRGPIGDGYPDAKPWAASKRKETTIVRCTRCGLIIGDEGQCYDCPGDRGRMHRLILERPNAD